MMRNELTQEGFWIRRVVDLPLLRSTQPTFNLGWTLMHVLDESSAMFDQTAETLRESQATFVLNMSGTDESTGQTLTARAHYTDQDIRWNTSFRDILVQDDAGQLHIDYSKFDDLEPYPDTPG